MKKVLLAGITGYLGGYIALELQKRAFHTRAVARNPEKLASKDIEAKIVKAEVTKPDTLKNCCSGIDVVISTIGITRQKDGLAYMDVDYQGNMNLLQEAQAAGVKKFIYVSVLNGEKLKHLKICEAKELFVEKLKQSGIDYCIIRPNGFFSDMTEFYEMATKGRIYLFGNGDWKTNPIHGEDLAEVCVSAIENSAKKIEIGGPETLTHNEIAAKAFEVVGSKPKISYIPEWVRVSLLWMIRFFTSSKVFGPIEFFMTVIAIDMVAPQYGKHTLNEFFTHLNKD